MTLEQPNKVFLFSFLVAFTLHALSISIFDVIIKRSDLVTKTVNITLNEPQKQEEGPIEKVQEIPLKGQVISVPKNIDKPIAAKPKSNAKQMVTRNMEFGRGETLVGVGNSPSISKKEAEAIAAKYEKVLAAWIEQHRFYPESAKERKLTGKASLLIQINRKGEILYYDVTQSTGHDILDKAAMMMAAHSNPVPRVPKDYPGGEIIQFMLPIKFYLE